MYEDLSKPTTYQKEIKLYSGTSNPKLAQDIADILHLKLQGLKIEKFANGEIYARFEESVRGDEVFFIQTIASKNVNDLIMETLIVADAATRASAESFTAVIPHYGYARQDRKASSREPITARLVANLLEAAGVDRVITLDLHSGQIQGFFDIPVTHLTALYNFGDYFKTKDFDWDNTVVVSPDMGRAKVAKKLSDYLGCEVAIAHKSRPKHNAAEVMGVIGDIVGKTCIINDDMIDTGGTLVGSINKLKEMGAGDIYVSATHGIFSGQAVERLQNAPIVECVVTDAIPCEVANKPGSKIKQISVAEPLATCIYNVYTNNSVSQGAAGHSEVSTHAGREAQNTQEDHRRRGGGPPRRRSVARGPCSAALGTLGGRGSGRGLPRHIEGGRPAPGGCLGGRRRGTPPASGRSGTGASLHPGWRPRGRCHQPRGLLA